ncbi:MAG: hypothetical protein FJ186_02065 [Gammaproteobacteria bacterium]|jgi:hypothetical protein|nr:hypothetical protein [Gammaproteobacteria bacterium]
MVQFFLGLTQQNPITAHLIHSLKPSTLPSINTHLATYPLTSIALLLIAIIFITYSFIAFKPKGQFIQELYVIEQQEYDFIGSQISYHSQLDIASAMIDMQQIEAAEKIIKDLKGRFIPDSELDHHLRAITKKLKTSGAAQNVLYQKPALG